ncbi:BF3164 family lipoprotein [Rhodonellum sp.]|uniref:BF3164 family lipoprotein n=1 Tax=Rhodonellum sp. TaxID=2231180 RepID=UPI0027194A17|nr:BF3164 family lipoprotein [Rhodonellum sp.]MDO9551649.1 BF3164 family lipoprotein [Rhodonellum sp.]
MKPSHFKLLLYISIFIISCNPSPKNDTEFNPEKLVSYYLVSEKSDNSNILNPRRLFSQGGFLFIIEDYRMPPDLPLIHIFRKDPITYFNSKGKIGFGPLEAQSVEVHNPGLSDSTFVMYSGMDRKYIEYHIYDSSRLGIREFRIPTSETPLGSIYFSPDSTFIGIPTYDENKFVEINLQGKKINGFGKWEHVEGKKGMSYFHHFHLNQGWFKPDDDFKLLVNASIFRDRLEIFDLQTKEIKTIDGPSAELPEFNFYEATMPLDIPISNPFRYRDVYISDKRIYALYGGLNEAHYKETSELAKKIFVFTRQGEPILKFDLDRSVHSIVVDEELNKIYGLTTDEDPGIAVFRMPPGVF